MALEADLPWSYGKVQEQGGWEHQQPLHLQVGDEDITLEKSLPYTVSIDKASYFLHCIWEL